MYFSFVLCIEVQTLYFTKKNYWKTFLYHILYYNSKTVLLKQKQYIETVKSDWTF